MKAAAIALTILVGGIWLAFEYAPEMYRTYKLVRCDSPPVCFYR